MDCMPTAGPAAPLADLPVMFDHSPLDSLPDFIDYCKYLYSCGSMGSDLYKRLGDLRRVLRSHREEIDRLKAAVRDASSPSCLSATDKSELQRIDEMSRSVELLEHTRKRNAYTLSQNRDNEQTCHILNEKLAESESLLIDRMGELSLAKGSSAAYTRRQAAIEALQAFYDSVGATSLETVADKLKSSSGRSCGSRGSKFETVGLQYVHDVFLDELSRQYDVPRENLKYTANVTLKIPQVTGSAGELDGLVFETDCSDNTATDGVHDQCTVVRRVLAVIEMKRNIDDIGPAFESRLRTLRWLAGIESGVDRELRKNKHYPSGRYCEPLSPKYHWHYDKSVKRSYLFRPESFRLFEELELENRGKDLLHFFVRLSPLTCVASGDSARIQYALASNVDIDEDAGLDSDVNAAAMDALRIKIRATSKQQSDMDSENSLKVVTTSFEVSRVSRLHLLRTDTDRN